MKLPATLLVIASAGHRTAIADPVHALLADAIRTLAAEHEPDELKVRVRADNGQLVDSYIDPMTARVVELADGRTAITLELEIADGRLNQPAQPAVLTGAESTEAERATAMPVLERQADEGNPQ